MEQMRCLRRCLALALVTGATLGAPAAAGAADPAWVQRALADQYELSSDVGFRNAPWVGTHNSFNSVAEMGPTLSALDSNQKITIVDQLDQGIRSLELDLHWILHIPEGFAPVVCHALPSHAGCTAEKSLGPVLDEIGGWLREPANSDQVLLLYINDYLDDETGYNTAAGIIEEKIGDLVYRPPAGAGCTELPLKLSRDQIRAAGKQVIIVSDCAVGAGWAAVVHAWVKHVESRPFDYQGFPDCGPDYTREVYDSTLVRYYEDSTQITQQTGDPDDGITPPTASEMARCGVDKIDLDQVVAAADPRLEALVWSWAPNQPKRGRCAVQRSSDAQPFGRWRSRRCKRHRPVACRSGDRWFVLKKPVRAPKAVGRCERRDATHAAPRTGFEVQLVRLAMERKGTNRALIGYRLRNGDWTALDER